MMLPEPTAARRSFRALVKRMKKRAEQPGSGKWSDWGEGATLGTKEHGEGYVASALLAAGALTRCTQQIGEATLHPSPQVANCASLLRVLLVFVQHAAVGLDTCSHP